MDLAAAQHNSHAAIVASAADDTYHATSIHHSPLQPTRLFSSSNNNNQSTDNNNQNSNHTATVNNNGGNNTAVNLKTLNLPRQLSPKEETNLRKLLLFQLNTSRRIQRKRCHIENEEDADNLVSYAMEWIMGGESVERVVKELKFIGMSVCGEVEADKIGVALTEFYCAMSGVDDNETNDEQKGDNVEAAAYSDDSSPDDIATMKKQLRAKKKRAKEAAAAAAVKNTNNQSRSEKKNGGVTLPPPSPPLGTKSPPSLKKKDGVRLFSSPPKSLILSSSSSSPREVIDANVSKDFAFIKDGSVSNIFRIQNQWDVMRNDIENAATKPSSFTNVDGEEEEFIGYINPTEIEDDYEAERVTQLGMWGIKEVSIPIQKKRVSPKSKKNIKNILQKNSTGFYDSSPKTVFEHNSLYVGFDGTYPQALHNSAGDANTFREKSHDGKHVVSQLERAVPPPSVAEVESEAAAAESEETAAPSDYSQRQTLTTKELQMTRMNTLNEYVTKIDSMKEELLREIKWQEQKEEQMTRIKTMEEYVNKIDVMKRKLVREITCMKADLEVVCSIDKSRITRQKKKKQKEEEANCVVYQLSCRKCQSRNQHTSFIGSSSLDIKTTIDGHLDRVVDAVLQRKGKYILADSDSKPNGEDWSNDFAQHFAKHCQRRTRFGSPKRLSKEDVINFCLANIKMEVLGDKKLIYGVANGGKLTATVAVPKK